MINGKEDFFIGNKNTETEIPATTRIAAEPVSCKKTSAIEKEEIERRNENSANLANMIVAEYLNKVRSGQVVCRRKDVNIN